MLTKRSQEELELRQILNYSETWSQILNKIKTHRKIYSLEVNKFNMLNVHQTIQYKTAIDLTRFLLPKQPIIIAVSYTHLGTHKSYLFCPTLKWTSTTLFKSGHPFRRVISTTYLPCWRGSNLISLSLTLKL